MIRAPVLAAALALMAGSAASAEPYVGAQGTYTLENYGTTNGKHIEPGEEQYLAGNLVLGWAPTRWAFAEAHLGFARAEWHGVNDGSGANQYQQHQATGEIRTYYGAAILGLQAPTPYVQPYVSAGLALGAQEANGRVDGRYEHRWDMEHGWRAEAGVRVPVGGRVRLSAGWRRLDLGAIEQDQVVFGIAWRFGR